MQIDSSMWNGGSSDGGLVRAREVDGLATSSSTPSPSIPSASGVNSIEHRVSKMDTLAGVAIKYGVEVSDIKRMNGLVTDIQMFAHKSLQIPLPGRHPPSPIMPNGSSCNGDHTPLQQQPPREVLESFQSLNLKHPQKRVSSAMRSLQGYYGLTPPRRSPQAEGTEMAVYRTERPLYLEDESLPRVSPISDQHTNGHHKSRSPVNGFPVENGDSAGDVASMEATENGEADRPGSEKSVRRRQKMDTTSPCQPPELLLKEDVGGGAFSGRTGTRLALRGKSGNRADLDSTRASPNMAGDSSVADGFLAVRRSSSTSNLQDTESSPSIWPASKWSLKPDAIARPIFDGLPKPITARRNKAALD